MEGIIKNFINAGVPPNQIFVSGVSAGGADAIRSAVHYGGKLINAGIAFHPANWGQHKSGARRTIIVEEMKSVEQLDLLVVNSNNDGTGARKIRPEDSQWMLEIPGVEFLVTADDGYNLMKPNDYEGDFTSRRSIIYRLSFTTKFYLYGPVTSSKVIKTVQVDQYTDLPDQSPKREQRYTVTPDPSSAEAGDDFGFNETVSFFQDAKVYNTETGEDVRGPSEGTN